MHNQRVLKTKMCISALGIAESQSAHVLSDRAYDDAQSACIEKDNVCIGFRGRWNHTQRMY
jgi:hypothetical protein